MSIEENVEFLNAIRKILGRKMTVAECYIAYALRDGKYQRMSDVPPLPAPPFPSHKESRDDR